MTRVKEAPQVQFLNESRPLMRGAGGVLRKSRNHVFPIFGICRMVENYFLLGSNNMKIQALKNVATFTAIFIVGNVFAQMNDAPPPAVNPYFTRVGTTIFVSGPLQEWASDLRNALPNPLMEAPWKKYTNDPTLKVERVVFFHTTSLRPEVAGGEIYISERMRTLKIDTVVMGRCDLFCSRYFSGGVQRQFAQELPVQKSFIDIQVPVDYRTQKLETRFPDTQLAVYQRNIPNIGSFKEVMVEGLTKGGWNGGLEIPAEGDVRFCEDRSPEKGCKTYVGVTALSMGFVTSQERVQIDIPKGFGDPKPTGFADINDTKTIPSHANPEVLLSHYQKFLERPVSHGRAFAISESASGGGFGWASGTNEAGNHVQRAINFCQEKSKSVCRLYAVGDKVVW